MGTQDSMLAFAAGAMIFVVVEEVTPEAQRNGETNITTMAAMFGLAIMFPWGSTIAKTTK
ncbi:hypothetical protein [Acetomicrobium sp.]|uniref:hypothetical protein n=1 Tax=Acetomicrobium sp. TaxID=1872099 RepID=UPI002FC6F4E6